ncbi:MAG: hypothetical protein WD045_11730 [Pirellulaceae bacterium]
MNLLKVLLLTAIVIMGGCGPGREESKLPPDSVPLTLEIWETLPGHEKYDGMTMERLRDSDPSLKSDAAWKKFMREVVAPQMKKDVPPYTPPTSTAVD